MAKHLRQLYNLTLAAGHVPSRWKQAVISPLPREGKDLSQPGSYRPISLLPTIAKLLEAILARRLYAIAEKKRIIPDYQSGFRSNRSTNDQLFRLAESIARGLASREATVATFLDFRGAFNNVWHDALRYKLANSPIPTCMTRWISSFLEGRLFCVRVGQETSAMKNARCGVPQGSCLSPLLFIIFTADMFSQSDKVDRPAVGAYADDVMVMATDKNPDAAARLVQLALRQAEWWSGAWRLPMQPNKCAVMVFSRRYTAPKVSLYLDGAPLQIVDQTTYLGVTFDRKFNFRKHFEAVRKAVEKRINGLRRICGRDLGFSSEAALQIYKTMIRSVMEYGSTAWVSRLLNKTDTTYLQTLQNRCLRTALRLPIDTPIMELHRRAMIPLFKSRLANICQRFITRAGDQVDGVRRLLQWYRHSPRPYRGLLQLILG